MGHSEIKAALRALRDMDNLHVPRVPDAHNVLDDNVILPEYRDKSINDIFDWLASVFGFQSSNASSFGELPLGPLMFGASHKLLNDDHYKVYFEGMLTWKGKFYNLLKLSRLPCVTCLHQNYACSRLYTHKFTKILVSLMKRAGWDLELAVNSVYSGVDYVKKGHSWYALLSYVCLKMFQGFDLEGFGVGVQGSVCNGDNLTLNCEEKRVSSLRQLKDHVSTNQMETLEECPNCEFSRFCERKYQKLIHPTMESSIFNELDQGEVVNSWK